LFKIKDFSVRMAIGAWQLLAMFWQRNGSKMAAAGQRPGSRWLRGGQLLAAEWQRIGNIWQPG
jgi:hypothetical protein